MTESIFISYSRQETPFINIFANDLDKLNFNVWLDYRSLIPGHPWLEQIYKGIDEADIIILVVSKASISSKNVEVEWQRCLNRGKRIILAIFESVELPAILEEYEWVDFRTTYKDSLDQLVSQIANPELANDELLTNEYKAPNIVWITFIFALLSGLLSLPTIWTIIIPWFLFTLPYRILKRNYNYIYVRFAIIFSPLALIVVPEFINLEIFFPVFDTYLGSDIIIGLFIANIVVNTILLVLLHTPSLERWGKPMAVRPKLGKRIKLKKRIPKSTSFYLDFAPQDIKIANEISKNYYNTIILKQLLQKMQRSYLF